MRPKLIAATIALLSGPSSDLLTAQEPIPIRAAPREAIKLSAEAGVPPTGLQAGATSTSIRLIWVCPQGATGYEVYATPKGGGTVKLTPVPITLQCYQDLSLFSISKDPRLPAPTQAAYISSFTHLGLAPATEFVYVVRALYPNGFGDSDPVTARTLWPAPTGFVASVAGRSANLQWNPVGASGYVVLRRLEGQSGFQPLTATPLAATSYTDNTDLPPGRHAYYVQGVNGEPSAAATVLVLVPAFLTATIVRRDVYEYNRMCLTSVKLTWPTVVGAAYYMLWGGGIRVDGWRVDAEVNRETYEYTDLYAPLRAGVNTWTIKVFLPGSTPSSTTVSLDVPGWIAPPSPC